MLISLLLSKPNLGLSIIPVITITSYFILYKIKKKAIIINSLNQKINYIEIRFPCFYTLAKQHINLFLDINN
ncbi:hypothetical protein L1987_26395 [Smallanthus sonchifolius]|uniref:Uncharacterized protein n=1 Tax=Smallanthus sonchifolius TaxID=185202 RepID=A0ACB9IAF1_9ASTR|nr:hypothetical protein L1987_26395 [Smallanthus sonchifolius]